MKRFIMMMMMGMLIISCSNQPEKTSEKQNLPYEYSIVMIEGCQYLKVEGAYSSYTLTHKGNCNNRIHSEHLRK